MHSIEVKTKIMTKLRNYKYMLEKIPITITIRYVWIINVINKNLKKLYCEKKI